MNRKGPVVLAQQRTVDVFQCRSEALDSWITTRALVNESSGASRTWVLLDDETVVASYAAAIAAVGRHAAPHPMRRNQPEVLPAVVLLRLAVKKNYQGGGLAVALLRNFMLKAFEVSERVRVSLLLVHAKEIGVRGFYEKYGFVQSPPEPLARMLLLPRGTSNAA